MSEIPEDIMKVAINIVTDICVKRGQILGVQAVEDEYLEQAIARAILVERERCAGIAEDHASTHDSRVADWIASAIRNPKP